MTTSIPMNVAAKPDPGIVLNDPSLEPLSGEEEQQQGSATTSTTAE